MSGAHERNCSACETAQSSLLRQRFRFRIRKIKVVVGLFLRGSLGLRPARFCGFSGASFALFVRHGFKSALATDPAALGSHLAHDLLNDGKFRGLCGFQEHPASVLDGIEISSSACPLWHTSQRGTFRKLGQVGTVSNRPTTRAPLPLYRQVPFMVALSNRWNGLVA